MNSATLLWVRGFTKFCYFSPNFRALTCPRLRLARHLGVLACDPEQGLANREGTLELWDRGIGWQRLPEIGVLRSAVGAGGEEQTGWANGQIGEVGGVGFVGPCSAIEDEGKVTSDGGAHAGAVLQLVVPRALESSGEQVADGGEHVQVEEGEAIGGEPFEVVGEPSLDDGEICFGEGCGVGQEGNRLGYFGEVDGFYDAFGTAGLRWRNDLRVEEAGGHAGCGIDEPCPEMSCCLLCVALFAGEDEGGGECGDVEAQVEECVAVGGEGLGVGCAGPLDVGGLRCGWVGPVVFGLGEEVVRAAWAAFRGERSEWSRGLGEIASGSLENAVVIDGGDVGAGACFGWGRWSLGQDARGDEKSSGLRAEVSAGCGHDERMLPAEEYHGGAGESLTMRWTIGWI